MYLPWQLPQSDSSEKNEIPRLLANRRSSAKALMTEPDIAHVVKEILGHESSTPSPVFTLHVELV